MTRRRNPLAQANQANRDLRNQIHRFDQEVALPLRAEIAQLKLDLERSRSKVADLVHLNEAYQQSWEARVRLDYERLASGKGPSK
jgi:hypothetical protein